MSATIDRLERMSNEIERIMDEAGAGVRIVGGKVKPEAIMFKTFPKSGVRIHHIEAQMDQLKTRLASMGVLLCLCARHGSAVWIAVVHAMLPRANEVVNEYNRHSGGRRDLSLRLVHKRN